MNVPLGPLLPHLRPHLGDLVGGPAWQKIETLTSCLPPLGQSGAFEVRLGAEGGPVDISLSSDGARGKQRMAEALASQGALPAAADVAPLLAEWVQPGTRFSESTGILWLEYDLAEEAVHPPMIYFGLRSPSGSEAGELMEHARRLVSRHPMSPRQRKTLELCFDAVPPGGVISFFADQSPARPTRDLRLVADLLCEDVLAWLEAIGWPGDREACGQALSLLGEACPYPSIYADVGEQVRPNLGIEPHLPDLRKFPEIWEVFLRHLAERGAATPEQLSAVTRWAGSATIEVSGVESLIRLDRIPGFKLVLDASGRLTAKVYLAYCTRRTLF